MLYGNLPAGISARERIFVVKPDFYFAFRGLFDDEFYAFEICFRAVSLVEYAVSYVQKKRADARIPHKVQLNFYFFRIKRIV